MRDKGLAALCTVVVVLVAACGSSSTAAPSAPNTTGTWTGTVSDAVMGQGAVRLTITQTGSSVAGTWATTYPNVTNNNGGSLTGSVNNTSVTATLIPSIPTTCPLNATATLNGNAMSGTYTAFNCALAVRGTINVSKQ
jgi:hypothetical protein